MYIYHALINPLSAHMIHINLNMIFYTHVEHSPTNFAYDFAGQLRHSMVQLAQWYTHSLSFLRLTAGDR